MTSKIVPDPQDFEAVGDHPGTNAEKYRLAQARKLVRLYEAGQLPAELMQELEKIRARKG
jgi:hypothetical protein